MASSLYQASIPGYALEEVADEGVRDGLFRDCPDICAALFEEFDQTVVSNFNVGSWSQHKNADLIGRITATVEWYRLVDSVYTFMLCDVSLTGGAFTGEVSSRATVYALPIRRLKLVAVDSKSVAASAAAAAAAAAERADGLPTANEGYVLGAGPSGADASDSESSSADDMPPPKAAAPTTRCGGSSSAAGATDGNETRQHTRGGANEDEGDLREADDGAPHRASDTHGAGQVDNSDAIDDEEDGAQGREGGGRSSMNQGGRTDDSHASTWADDGASDVSEEPLNSADDEEEDEDSVNADFEAGVPRAKQHLMVAQLDKVRRTKDLWKVTLRGGMATLCGGRGFAFARADCELKFA